MSSHNNLDTLYRQVIMDHYKNPRNRGELENETLHVNMNNHLRRPHSASA